MDIEVYLACAFVGAALACGAFFGRDYMAMGLGVVERDLADKMRRLRAPTKRLRTYIIVWLIAIAGTFAMFAFALNNVVFALVLSAFLVCAPWYLVRRMAERRRVKLEDQLADAMVTLSSAVKAGLSLVQSLELLAAQLPKPISTEFQQMITEYKLGKTLQHVLLEAKQRLQSENFALFAAALMASHESGGRLNETVERIAKSVLELQRLERKVMAETAQARKSAVYMALAPAFILVAYYFVDPVNTRLLFTTIAGQILLAFAIVLNVAAYLWARLILNPDI
jgi:tight adherence protein B